jgi:hypothetical protein
MNPHLRFAVLVVGLAGLGVVIWLLRFEKWVHADPTTTYDRLLVVLGVGLVAVVVSYVLTLRRRAAVKRGAVGAETPGGETPAGEVVAGEAQRGGVLGIERLIGRKAGRLLNIILLVLVGLAALFLVGLLGYIGYLQLFSGP